MHTTPSTIVAAAVSTRGRRVTAVLLALTCLVATFGPSFGELWGSAPPNLLTRDQQTFENGVQGWVGTGTSTLSAVKTPTYEGSRALAVKAGKTPRYRNDVGWLVRFILSNSGAETLRGTSGIPVTPGWQYDGKVRVRAQKAERAVRCELEWFDRSGVSISSTAGQLSVSKTTSWTKVTCSAKAPKGAATASLRVYFFGIGAGDVNYLDDAWLSTTDGAPAEAAFAMRVNAGGPNAYKTPGGTLFQADQGFRGGLASGNIGTTIAGTNSDSLYVKHRWGMSGYTIPVPSAATYTVRLHFAETVFTAPRKRVFDVSAEGTRRLAGLDVFAKAGADRALIEQFDVKVTDGVLVLGFTAQIEDPMVSGIEVLQQGSTAANAAPSTTTTAAPTTTTTAAPTTTTTKPPAPTTTTTAPPPPPPPVTTPPASGGLPNASNTGPSGSLTPSGTISTSRNGQVIQNVDVTGSIRVNHSNVVIRNVRVRQPGGTAIAIDPATSGTVVEDCELDGTGWTSSDPAISYARYTIRRCDIHHFGEGPMANGDVLIEGNYMHDFVDYGSIGAHQDGVQIVCNNNITIRNNTILMNVDGANAAIMIGTACGPVDNVLVEGNLLAGGGYTVYGGSAEGYHSNATNVRIVNNRLSTRYYPRGGYWGPFAHTWRVAVSGNVWHESGGGI